MLKKNLESFLSVFAVVISFIAAGVAWWQLDVAREHNKISVRPFINITPYLEGVGGRNGVFISNQGLGPAVIKGIEVKVGEKSFSGLGNSQWKDAIEQAGSEPLCFKHGWPIENSVIYAGAEEMLLAPTEANLPVCSAVAAFFQLEKDVEILIEYESFYGESFEAKGSTRINADLF